MKLLGLIPIFILAGCGGIHFCSDELMMITMSVPMLGVLTSKWHAWRHKKKCPHVVKPEEIWEAAGHK